MYTDKNGVTQAEYQEVAENHYFQYSSRKEDNGSLPTNSREYQNLMKYARHSKVGDAIVKQYINNPKNNIVYTKKGKPICCSSAELRFIFGQDSITNNNIYNKAFSNLFNSRKWDAVNGKNDFTLYKRTGVPRKFWKWGDAVDAVEWKGYGVKLTKSDIDSGLLEPGAVISIDWGTHIAIFTGYKYDENNTIEGYYIWDQDGKTKEYRLKDYIDQLTGINYNK